MSRGYKKLLGVAFDAVCGYALGMAKHLVVRFYRHNSMHLTDEYRSDDSIPHTLAYVDHNGNGTVDVQVFDPYTGRDRFYTNRPTSKGLGIVSRHLERVGYKNCLSFQNLTEGPDAGKL